MTWHYTDLLLFALLIISKAGLVGSFVEQVMDNRTKMKFFNKMSGSALIYKIVGTHDFICNSEKITPLSGRLLREGSQSAGWTVKYVFHM